MMISYHTIHVRLIPASFRVTHTHLPFESAVGTPINPFYVTSRSRDTSRCPVRRVAGRRSSPPPPTLLRHPSPRPQPRTPPAPPLPPPPIPAECFLRATAQPRPQLPRVGPPQHALDRLSPTVLPPNVGPEFHQDPKTRPYRALSTTTRRAARCTARAPLASVSSRSPPNSRTTATQPPHPDNAAKCKGVYRKW